jgi:hypothetical protein
MLEVEIGAPVWRPAIGPALNWNSPYAGTGIAEGKTLPLLCHELQHGTAGSS